ncbi:DUF1778 domain-containing protein [Salipiger mucosus]|uniref:type II toxin-antitoxin system TacA family antitoxin n=1 Tax=Salipiger mucosus TaxID=263378 RepID=UPI000A06C094|nr:DUF1778 domain-containing protein [Salipiger mucosus]
MLPFVDQILEAEGRADARMSFRTKARVKATIQKAAALSGVDESTFTMSAAYGHALKVIDTHENTFLKDVDHEMFFSALDNPPEPTDALKAAFARYANELKR